jgi:hypothetical protein
MDVDAQVAPPPTDEGLADPEYLQQVLEGLPSNPPKKEKKPEPKSGGSSKKK